MNPLSNIAQHSRLVCKSTLLTCSLSAFLFCSSTEAETYSIDNLVIDEVYTFATPPGAQSAGGYLTITNTGADDDTLVGGTSSFANVTQVHEMKMVDDVMKMRHLENGLAIPAGATVKLVPGGFHMMFMQLTKPFKDGESIGGTLTFSNAGELPVSFQVIDRRNQNGDPGMKHGHMQKADTAKSAKTDHDNNSATSHDSMNDGDMTKKE